MNRKNNANPANIANEVERANLNKHIKKKRKKIM